MPPAYINQYTIMKGKKYQTGFALSGGFIRGIAHLGMLQALFEHKIRPDILSGTSAGAIVSAFIADGKQPFEILQLFSQRSFTDLAKIRPNKESLMKMDYFIDFLKSNLKAKRIEKLSIPTVITATDFDNGKSVHFTKGEITRRIAASCCIPVLFPPISINGTHYVDGGLFMNIPISPIRSLCDEVIALNVYKLMTDDYKNNLVNIALRAYHFMFQSNCLTELELADWTIAPDGLEKYSNYELDKAEEIFSTGYFTTLDFLKEYKKTKTEYY